MKSVLLRKGPGRGKLDAVVSEVAVPPLRKGDILVRMSECGLCGTDLEKIRGEYTAAMPVIGHEAVGVVSAVGDGAPGFKEGERVFPHHHVPCYQCYMCKHGSETMCSDYRTSNLDPGGFSEFIRVPAWNVSRGGVLRVPDSVSDDEATMIEPVACCVKALAKCKVEAGDSVLVVGAGPVGMSHALLLSSMKAEVMVSDVSEPRIKFAEGLGAGTVLNAAKDDVPKSVKGFTGGRGADVAIVASGSQKAVTQAMDSVRKGGLVCLFGIPVNSAKFEQSVSGVYNSEVSIVPSYGATEADTTKALELIARRAVDLRPLVSHRFRLDDFAEGLRAAAGGDAMKVVMTP